MTRPLGQPLSLHRQSEISANEIRRKQTTKQIITIMEKIEIKSLPEIIVASHREVIPSYADLGYLCYAKIGP